MSKRVCANCGKEKDVSGGRMCEKGHFICRNCVYEGSGLIFTHEKYTCPLCKKPLK